MGSVGSRTTNLSNRLMAIRINNTTLKAGYDEDIISQDLALAKDSGYKSIENGRFDVNVNSDKIRYTGASNVGRRVKELQDEYGVDNVIVLQSKPAHLATIPKRGYYTQKNRAEVQILVRRK